MATRISGTTVAERVKEIIADQFGVDLQEVTPGSSLRDDLGGDSLDLVETVMRLETEFGIQIDDEAGDAMKTVQDAVDVVEKLAVKQ